MVNESEGDEGFASLMQGDADIKVFKQEIKAQNPVSAAKKIELDATKEIQRKAALGQSEHEKKSRSSCP